MEPYIWLAVGLPASGKSTWAENNLSGKTTSDIIVLGTDQLIDMYAALRSTTYDEVFRDYIDTATTLFFDQFRNELKNERNIFIDRTNLNEKSRKRILNMVPKDYHKIAIVFDCSDGVRDQRLASRPGKTIPNGVIDSMKLNFKYPTLDEGFNQILEIVTDHTAPDYRLGLNP